MNRENLEKGRGNVKVVKVCTLILLPLKFWLIKLSKNIYVRRKATWTPGESTAYFKFLLLFKFLFNSHMSEIRESTSKSPFKKALEQIFHAFLLLFLFFPLWHFPETCLSSLWKHKGCFVWLFYFIFFQVSHDKTYTHTKMHTHFSMCSI